MDGTFIFLNAAAARGYKDGFARHVLVRVASTRENELAAPGQGMQVAQDFNCLRGKGSDVRALGLGHKIASLARIQVQLDPPHPDQFAGTGKQ